MTEFPFRSSQDELSVYFGGFHNLMPFRVQHVLLVSSLYDSFILEEDGLLTELITSEYMDMNLSHAPRVTRVSTCADALAVIEEHPVDLVIAMTRLGGARVADFAVAAKQLQPALPVVVLADEARTLVHDPGIENCEAIDRTFVWNGDAKILLAIIKFVEDRLNAEHDTAVADVRVILLVENSVHFYSAYLPLIYTELMKLTQALIADGVNLMHRLLRMRARPRILLAETFEEAWDTYTTYKENILGIISDVRFPRAGIHDPLAGIEFTRRVREDSPFLPVLLQSSDPTFRDAADQLNVVFLHKKSRNLMRHLREFILSHLGFGDFVFRLPGNQEVGRARDLRELEVTLSRVPPESVAFHARNNHFSNWLMARTEFELAARIRPTKVTDFDSIEEVRTYLVSALAEFREKSQRGVITDFSPRKFDITSSFTRIGAGSIGGKARGLAFVNALIRHHNLARRFDNVRIFVPNSATLGTDVFDRFLDENSLRGFVAEDIPDERISQVFLAARMPKQVYSDLAAFLRYVRYPLAVRSSSLLEDSQGRPFAGIYATHMLTNNHPDLSVRLDQLCTAIKRVYASAFFEGAKRYLDATGHNLEEEKMAVTLQELVGSHHGPRFYPTFSGVARSYNFYPTGGMDPTSGVAAVALGLGKMVVEGGQSLMFCPDMPEILPQFPTTEELFDNSQRKFYALDTSHPDVYPEADGEANIQLCDLDLAEQDGTLEPIGSTYSPENDMVYDGIHRPGRRLVTFAHVLKSGVFPLAKIIRLLLDIGEEGLASPIEIEFAVDTTVKPMEFGFLQIRPIILNEEYSAVSIDNVPEESVVCTSPAALGNGRSPNVYDIVYVKPRAFSAAHTREIADEVGKMNEILRREERMGVFIGPGRWGTADRWLGIPVRWDQISRAQLIVETTLQDFMVNPSQGTHFFQNLTSLGIGYFAIDPHAKRGHIDWDWFEEQPSIHETAYVRHIRLLDPLELRIDGRNQRGVLFRPET